jgi:hypothetical protein
MLGLLAEQLQQRVDASPTPANASVSGPDKSHLLQDVVLPFVEALRHAEDPIKKKTASQRFLLDLSRMTPVDKVMNDDVQNALNHSALEQLGIPEVPLPFDFEGDQDFLHQLVEVAEGVVAEVSAPEIAPILTDAIEVLIPTEQATEDDVETAEEDPAEGEEPSASFENLDEIIKRKRHALNKQSGVKPKKRTAQNHKKKKK